MKLNELAVVSGSRKSRIRVGRGSGSGVGKTCRRGVKGQKSRSGVAIKGFEGGQMPIYRRLPKRGFTNYTSKNYEIVNLNSLQEAIDSGKLDLDAEVTSAILLSSGVVSQLKDGVRILARGEIKSPIKLAVEGASKSAITAIESAGGTITRSVPSRIERLEEQANSEGKRSKRRAARIKLARERVGSSA